MPGRVSFSDEEEYRQSEALAGRMLEDVATQHAIVGQSIERVVYTSPSWHPDSALVDDLRIEFSSGLVITARQARLDLSSAPRDLREALRAENERQRPTAPSGLRSESERLTSRPGPELDVSGDPVQDEQYPSHAEYPIDPPAIEGTDITYES